mmetsp:Transcript_32720/g.60255  ORF Transcript_32720/g.60255 Transcript_32720/m.60255 type:complete len:114 (+) Transcript_32720:199-540(+)
MVAGAVTVRTGSAATHGGGGGASHVSDTVAEPVPVLPEDEDVAVKSSVIDVVVPGANVVPSSEKDAESSTLDPGAAEPVVPEYVAAESKVTPLTGETEPTEKVDASHSALSGF